MSAPDEIARLQAWADVLEESSYYEILGVLEIADEAGLRDAFHRFSLGFHPDVHRDASPAVKQLTEHIFRRGAEAYRVLIDPEMRVRYDMGLRKGELRLAVRHSTRPPPAPTSAKPLHELCRSAGAKLLAQKADKLLATGELKQAHAVLLSALESDGGANPALSERIEALELMLYATGD